jgi:ubiquinone/menaquinone biosynthesis C-methylase UbiE
VAQALLTAPQRQTTAFYDKAAARYAKYAAQIEMDGTLGGFLSTIERDHTVLDIGCGSGRDLTTLRDIAGAVFGLDLSLGLLAEARCASRAPVVTADASSLPFIEGHVDRVIAVASLHHLPRRAQVTALREIRRVLRVDGRALVTLKVGRRELRDHDVETGEVRVFYLISPRRFVRRARRSGLRVVEATTSLSQRHGRDQLWLALQLDVRTRTWAVRPNRRRRGASPRRS